MENEEEIKALRNEYARNWRKRNPEKVKATNERFYKRLKIKKEQEKAKNVQKGEKAKMSKFTLNIDTDLDELIKKCNELNQQLEELGDKSKQLYFLTIKDVADMMNCSKKTVQDLFNLPDFPSIDFTKSKIVLIDALKEWCMTKRSKKDYE